MIIRQAVEVDLPALVRLAQHSYADAFGHTFTASDLAAHLETHLSRGSFERYLHEDALLVAEHDGALIGFIQIGAVKPGFFDVSFAPGDLELRRVYVLASSQGQGIGTQLIDMALALPQVQAAPHIYLDVFEENVGAQKLYTRYGFAAIGRRRFETASAPAGFDIIMVRRKRP